jgi:hypothetical protein
MLGEERPDYQKEKVLRKKAVVAPYERNTREQLHGIRMEVHAPKRFNSVGYE